MNFADPLAHQWATHETRRSFFAKSAHAVGLAALGSLLNPRLFAKSGDPLESRGVLRQLHFPAKAKHVIYLHQSGAPSHIDLFDYKPGMKQHEGLELPASVRMGQRITRDDIRTEGVSGSGIAVGLEAARPIVALA